MDSSKVVSVRSATPADADLFADLVFLASPEYLLLFGNNARNVMRRLFTVKHNLFSHDCAHIAEVNGSPAGFMLGYDYGKKSACALRTGLLIVQLAGLGILRNAPFLIENAHNIGRQSPGEFFLSNIAVRPEFRRYGIGKVLCRKLEDVAAADGAERIVFETNCSNTAALSFYKGLGYSPTETFSIKYDGETKSYHRMEKHLRS